MKILTLAALYILAHLLLYLIVLRHWSSVQTEKRIFLYHFLSVIILVGSCALVTSSQGLGICITSSMAVGAMHGIYSMTFLELWSLAQGSFSFQVLRAIDSKKTTIIKDITDSLAQIGDQKKNQRIDSLYKLNLVRKGDDQINLTCKGRCVANVLRILRWIPNLRDTG